MQIVCLCRCPPMWIDFLFVSIPKHSASWGELSRVYLNKQVYCLNGGTCNAASTACTCRAGFAGTNCGARVSENASPGSTGKR